MDNDFSAAMRRATSLTRVRDIAGATKVIREALGAAVPSAGAASPHPAPLRDTVLLNEPTPASSSSPARATGLKPAPWSHRAHRSLSDVVRVLKDGRAKLLDIPPAPTPAVSTPPAAHFMSRSFACDAGSRSFKLYVPTPRDEKPWAVLVMLHGCQQNPDDFALGTRMNEVAEAQNLIVAYPHQTAAANAGSCWNWFSPAHQLRDRGEPAIIAGLTRQLMQEFDIPAGNAFCAGLSAGGAMAAVLAETYPDLFAAVGAHSGLPYASASDVVSAFATMRGDGKSRPAPAHAAARKPVRMIVFHGTSDTTVHPSNSAQLVDDAAVVGWQLREEHLTEGAGDTSRRIFSDSTGRPMIEYWQIEGLGHAWSGGDTKGSFTDARGPHASAEMVRFFSENRRAGNRT